MDQLPVACSLGPDALAARRNDLLSKLAALAQSQEPLAVSRGDGWRMRFPADDGTLDLILSMVRAERKCCQFLRFAITVEPADGPVLVDLTGPPGTRDFLAALFESARPEA